MKTVNPLRIGFLSTAGIGRKNWKAILNSGNCVVAAVASRDPQKGRQFIERCQSEHPFQTVPSVLDYAELIGSPEVDAIYLPLPTGLRAEWAMRAAAHGKHILCEKPCAASATELASILDACRKNSVQFLDGVMFMHHPRLGKMRAALEDGGGVGPLRRISSAFSFRPDEAFMKANIRTNGNLEPAGCAGDLGWYCIRLTLWAFGWRLPESVSGRILAGSENLPDRPSTPVEFAASMDYPGGATADYYCSFLAGRQQWAHLSGQNGWLRVDDFVQPLDSYTPRFEVNEKPVIVGSGPPCPPGCDPMAAGHATAQDTRMWRAFAEQILSGKLNPEWPMWALKTQRLLDACLESARLGKPVKPGPCDD